MKTCMTCEFWLGSQTGRPNPKGICFRYPTPERGKYSNHWCGEHKESKQKRTPAGLVKRHELMKELKTKRPGLKLDMRWTVKDLEAKLEEANEQDKKTKTTDGQGEE